MSTRPSLQSVYRDPNFSEFGKPSDAIVKTDDGTEFHVYSASLSTHSEFFKALFSIDDAEIEKSTTIHGIDPDVLETVLIYLYTSRVNLTTENMLGLLVASDFLLIESLLSECKVFILRNKSIENCVRVFLTAHRIKEFDIEYQYRRFFLICFEKALGHSMDIASDFPYCVLKYFLGNGSLNITGEHVIWSLIKAWVEKDPSNRMEEVPELLRFLSLNEIEEDLASDLITSTIIREHHLYEELGDPRLTLEYLSDQHKAQTVIIYRNEVPVITEARLPEQLHFVTKRSSQGVDAFISYDDRLDMLRKVGDLPFRHLKLLRIEHRIYIIEEGTNEDFHRGFRGFFYDLFSNEIKTMAPIVDFAAFYKYAVEVAGRIYVFGEFSTGRARYLEETDEWTDVAAIQGLGVLEAVSLNDRLYVIGFIGLDLPFRLIIKLYDPETDTCMDVSSPDIGRVRFEAVAYQEKIFLVGGYDLLTGNFSRAVEVYDPALDEWELYPELLYPYRDVSSVVLEGRLYVYDYRWSRTPVTFWDVSAREWRVLEDKSKVLAVTMCYLCSIEGVNLVREVMKKNKEFDVFHWEESGMK